MAHRDAPRTSQMTLHAMVNEAERGSAKYVSTAYVFGAGASQKGRRFTHKQTPYSAMGGPFDLEYGDEYEK